MIARRAGLAALMICTLLPIALSATGSRLVVVTGAVFVCLPLLLASALAWTGRQPGRTIPRPARALREKRILVATCLLAVALIPVTWWPLRLAFVLSRPAITHYAIISMLRSHQEYDKVIKQETEGPNLPMKAYNGDEGNPLAVIIHTYASVAGLPTEDLYRQEGAFALREMRPLTLHAFAIHLEAVGGGANLIYYTKDNPITIQPDYIPLGGGWWFVSD